MPKDVRPSATGANRCSGVPDSRGQQNRDAVPFRVDSLRRGVENHLMKTIPNRLARRHLISLQGLGAPDRSAPHPALIDRITALGFVQVDSINIVERAHHQILHARQRSYRPPMLSRLVERDRTLFENWTHDASVIPTTFFPYWRHRFARRKLRLRERWKSHFGHDGFDDDLARIRDHVTEHGPVLTRDFEGDKPSTGWWDWHPSKAALEFLWRTGEFAITRRVGFQKVYDLAERVIPRQHFDAEVSHDAFVDWACRQALARLGFATRGEIAGFWGLLTPPEVEEWLSRNNGDLETVLVEGQDGANRHAFALPGVADTALSDHPVPSGVRILSPFDPLLRDRKRGERLFGFSYRIEVFVPEAKRQFGYYVFPVLRGDRLIGRIDMKADRATGTLNVRAFWPERGVRRSRILQAGLERAIETSRRLAGVDTVAYETGWLRETP